MTEKIDDKTAMRPNLDTLRVIRDAARAARQRIIDGRAREGMAIFEHELTARIETFAKTMPPVPPVNVPPRPFTPPPPPRPAHKPGDVTRTAGKPTDETP